MNFTRQLYNHTASLYNAVKHKKLNINTTKTLKITDSDGVVKVSINLWFSKLNQISIFFKTIYKESF